MSQDDARFAAADRLFDQALDLPAAERVPFVEAAAGGDAELARLVLRLLREIEGPGLAPGGAWTGELGAAAAAELAAEAEELPPGTRLGRYRVLAELGRGGMAVVYLAERADGEFEQRVAIKRLKRGLDSEELLRRFEQERQILAHARHPGLARLLDGGAGPDGRPYLVMELVEGLPIDAYCDEHRLPVRARVELFLEVARAVEAAHRNLVVHRDIKPSNLLVSPEGHPKLLDFGIAKLLGPEPAAAVTTTRLLTPAWASPEQLRGDPVTTASDVYQLGLLLFVLLVGRLPPRPAADTELPRASALVRTAPDSAVAQRRGTTPAALAKELSGDLDALLAVALRPEPERRYASVSALVADLELYLRGRPIAARGDRLRYRLGKFLARHRVAAGVAVAATALLTLTVGLYTGRLAHERDRATRAATRSTETAEFLRGLFAVAGPSRERSESLTARALLDQSAARLETQHSTHPETRAELLLVLAGAYRDLAFYGEAEALARRAVAQRREHPGERQLGLAEALHALAGVLVERAAYEEAATHYAEAHALRRAGLGDGHPDTARSLVGRGRVELARGELARASATLEGAFRTIERALGAASPEAARAARELAAVERSRLRFPPAIALAELAATVLERQHGADHPEALRAQLELADLLDLGGEDDRATALYTATLPRFEAVFGSRHPALAHALVDYGSLLLDRRDLDGAAPHLERGLRIHQETLGPDHPTLARSWNARGRLYRQQRDLPGAAAAYREALRILEASLGADHPNIASLVLNLADVSRLAGDDASARPLYLRALRLREGVHGPQHSVLILPLFQLGEIEMRAGRPAEAEPWLARALALAEGGSAEERHGLAMPEIALAVCRLRLGRASEAEAVLLRHAQDASAHPEVRKRATAGLVELYRQTGQKAELARWEAAALRKQA